MAALIFRNFSQTTLETWLTATGSALSTGGKTIISYSEAGRSVTKTFPMSMEKFLEEINAALEYKDPAKYRRRVTETKVSFWPWAESAD